jgi:hypothetical protein
MLGRGKGEEDRRGGGRWLELQSPLSVGGCFPASQLDARNQETEVPSGWTPVDPDEWQAPPGNTK